MVATLAGGEARHKQNKRAELAEHIPGRFRVILKMASTSPEQTPQTDSAQEAILQLTPEICTDNNEQSSPLEEKASYVDEGDDSNKLAMESLVNPPLPDELGEAECAILRGDAIGSTTYTHRWVLHTLLTITEALPQYLTTGDRCVKIDHKMTGGDEEADTEHTEKQHSSLSTSNVIELEEDVENAACQLWDMTAEPDVVSHLLNLDVVDILQLAKEIITLSRAPRLTEVVVGVVANLCCQAEGCEKVIASESLLPSCLAILHSTDDVPTLVEAFRLLKLLLWHTTYRVPMEKRCQYPLVTALKNHESMKEALVFLLKNSLSDSLLNAVFEFLEALLYLWLPADQYYMAAHYSESGLIEGVVLVMKHFLKQWEKNGGQENPLAVHRGVLILYSFVATPAVQTISSFDQYESLLEPVLARYVEHMAKVEKVEELYEEERAERLVYALGLYELLVPTMRQPSILLHIGKLLALTHGGSYHYIAVPVKDDQELHKKERLRNRSGKRHRRLSSRSKRHSHSSEEMDVDTDCPSVVQAEKETATVTKQERERVSKREKEEKDKGSRISNLTDSPAVRVQEPALVGQLQEQILDSGTHNRLVTILSDMYA
ncbi:hypothetical protein O3P69_008080 [Scylla paramamosain]|uniref:Uncharacterized protein n=2 Tax=Scylla paramamosain TaxID=85552 RepID=A0AAW0T1Q1_SCYPA